MSRKAYTIDERNDLKRKLHKIGLDLYLKQGIQNVNLPQILKEAGISKPFFYKFYPSLGDLIIDIIDSQIESILDILNQIQKDEGRGWKEKVELFLTILIHYREHGIYVLSPEEEVWLFHRLSKVSFQCFQEKQILFYRNILTSWEISCDVLSPQVFGNFLLSLVIVRNHAATSLPFLFHEDLDETVSMQLRLFLEHIEEIHNQSVQ